MKLKPFIRQAAELGIGLTALATLILAGCGGGGGSSATQDPSTPTAAVRITSYKGPYTSGTVVIKDANGNPVTLISGGTINASGVANVTISSGVLFPLSVEVTGTYYNEVTGALETSTVPLRSLIASSAVAADVPVTIVTETAVVSLLEQLGGSFNAASPVQPAAVRAALDAAGTMYGIPASAVPSFDPATHTSSDPNTLRLAALAVVASNQGTGTTLAAQVQSLANTMATLNAASSPADVISQADLNAAMTVVTSGASSVAAAGTATVTPPTIPTTTVTTITNNANSAAGNTIVGSWAFTTAQGHRVVFSLFSSGDYVEVEDGATNSSGQSGMERGTYTWNAATGLLVSPCPTVDTNGEWGLSHPTPGVCTGANMTVTVSGNTLTLIGGSGQPQTLNRVVDATKPIVGTWSSIPLGISTTAHNVAITFLANGEYAMAVDAPADSIGQSGIERGTYTWNAATSTIVTACPTVDTNGQWGLSHATGNGCTGATVTLTVNGDLATLTDPQGVQHQLVNVNTTGSASSTLAAASAVAAVNSWFAELSVAGNSNGWWESTYFANAAAAASGVSTTDVYAWTDTTSVSGNTITFNGNSGNLKLSGGSWVTDTDPEVPYHLTSTGWVANSGGTVVNNLDGTITVLPTGMDPSVETITRTDLSGTLIPCWNATCTGTATYPAGSFSTSTHQVTPVDQYRLTTGRVQNNPAVVTDQNGVALTALPAPGSTICVHIDVGGQVFAPITPAPATGDNYNVYGTWSCAAADITAALASTAQGTVTVSAKATGIAGVTVGLVTAAAGSPVAGLNNYFVAVYANKLYPGWMRPTGKGHLSGMNRTAANAELTTNGHPALP